MYVGIKMLLTYYYHIDTLVSLSVIGGVLFLGVIASMYKNKKSVK
jgi:tellurite resistance protein TerC